MRKNEYKNISEFGFDVLMFLIGLAVLCAELPFSKKHPKQFEFKSNQANCSMVPFLESSSAHVTKS